MFQALAAEAGNESATIDSTIVRAHQHSAGTKEKPVRARRSAVSAAIPPQACRRSPRAFDRSLSIRRAT